MLFIRSIKASTGIIGAAILLLGYNSIDYVDNVTSIISLGSILSPILSPTLLLSKLKTTEAKLDAPTNPPHYQASIKAVKGHRPYMEDEVSLDEE